MIERWNLTLIIILILLASGLIYLLQPILTPFLVGALLAYLFDPLVNKLMRLKIPRLLSVVIVFLMILLLITLIILLLIPLVQKQIAALIVVGPAMVAWVQNTILPWLSVHFGTQEVINIATLKATLAENWTTAGGFASHFIKTIFHSGLALFVWGMNLVLIPVVTFYLLRDWGKIVGNVHDLLPRKVEPTVVTLVKDSDSVLSAFFRGQLLVMLILGIFYSLGLTFIGLQIGVIIGLISGLVAIVPYLGFILGVTTASIAALVQFGTLSSVASVFFVYILGQLLESMILTPFIVGDRIGLHPVAVIFAVLTGGALFGFCGVLLALPVSAVIMVWIRFLKMKYQSSKLYR